MEYDPQDSGGEIKDREDLPVDESVLEEGPLESQEKKLEAEIAELDEHLRTVEEVKRILTRRKRKLLADRNLLDQLPEPPARS